MRIIRTNVFRLKPIKNEEKKLYDLCRSSALLWNEINQKRRDLFQKNKMNWVAEHEYKKYKGIIGSATTQQIIRKNDETWKSFISLLKMKKGKKLPNHINKISPPSGWINKNTGKLKLKTLFRNDCYKIDNGCLFLPSKLVIKISGVLKWKGKQGRLEISYDFLRKKWYGNQSMELEIDSTNPKGNKKAFVDLGVLNLLTVWIENENQAIIYSGRPLLADWKYWATKINKLKSEVQKHGNKTSDKIRRLKRKQRLRFRHCINTIVYRFIQECSKKNVKEIFIGNVKYIRNNNNKGKRVNTLIHNFWSFGYINERLRISAMNEGIQVSLVDEKYTSQICSLCGKKHKKGRKYRGLYVCETYNKKINADVNAVANLYR
ncbi:MAG: transposase, partial [Candidatus Heimdallarchaeota archaeon]|nr:transposase [Candidatus Heimdallarchaeota archaeon]MCK4878585.1 transposase [Candidatus Heimdallarchaeota archaeon]